MSIFGTQASVPEYSTLPPGSALGTGLRYITWHLRIHACTVNDKVGDYVYATIRRKR